ncbi:DNA helicase/exodeoxyribonuclease V, subunit A [Syntrophobacter sp. SbD1]|nr:DNA helicase/exodeoxyribonuclease V, subunit A [Syntrophobacter sp. SbD1]
MFVLADAEKRSRALEPAGSFHLTAPAGSGKTFLLVSRFLRLLGLVDHPRQILALTFTNKAAAEMRERVKGCLERAKSGPAPGSDADTEAEAELIGYASKALAAHSKLEELLLSGEILDIRTFHSFCYAVASQAPFEAGIAPGSALMDENEQEIFIRETVNDALQQIASRKEGDAPRRALMNRLLYLNNSWPTLANEMKDLVERRGGLLEMVRVLSRDRASGYLAARVREMVEVELDSLKTGFEACELGRGWDCFIEQTRSAGAEAACTLPAAIPGPQWEDLPRWICLADTFLTKEGGIRSRLGPKTGFYGGFAKSMWGCAIQDMPSQVAQRLHDIRQLPAPDAPVTDPDILWDLVVLLHSVIEIYDARRRAKRTLDYSALELAALRLFDAAEPSDLQLMLDQQIRHILVDEFQDTSRVQWELLQKLCAGWSDETGRKTLFIVGDPKQSIYAFRKAEVKLFMDARRGLPVEGGANIYLEPLVLDTNFRSQPHLIDWCNSVFERTVMADPQVEFDEVPFSPAKPSPTTRVHSDPAPIELALFMEWPERESARRREAQWLAGRIARHIEENGRHSHNAILLFSRTHLPVYLEALQQKKIQVQVKEGLKLRERPEVFYLWQLCRGIVLPQDDLAWAAQLRSPWFSLDFDRIYKISREAPALWVEKIHAFSQADSQTGSFWEALTSAWQHAGRLPLADVVESAWLDLEGAQVVLSRWGSRGLNCCRRFLHMLREAEQGEPVHTLVRFEQLLQKAYEPVDPDSASSNIVLSTVHGAKGLEFDTVFMPFMDWDPESRRKDLPPPYMIERAPHSGDYLLASRPDRLTGEKDPLYTLLRKLRSKRQLGEAKRVFYVAVTRAKSELVMSGLVKKKADSFSTDAESPLGWLGKHYGIEAVGPPAGFATQTFGGGENNPTAPSHASADEWKRSTRYADGFIVNIEPDCGDGEVRPIETIVPEFAPARFEREKPVFTVVSPSDTGAGRQIPDAIKTVSLQAGHLVSLTEPDAARSGQSTFSPAACPPHVWGTLVHRLLADFGKTGALPSARRTSAALSRIGIESSRSIQIAREALAEVKTCLDDPWLQTFYTTAPDLRRVEWALECAHAEDIVFSGIIDLAAQIEGKWKLVDFKTSIPLEGEPIGDFLRRETDVHRPQILAYCEMVTKIISGQSSVASGQSKNRKFVVEAFIYFTNSRNKTVVSRRWSEKE